MSSISNEIVSSETGHASQLVKQLFIAVTLVVSQVDAMGRLQLRQTWNNTTSYHKSTIQAH